MELNEIYQEINKRLDKINFSFLYRGFYRLKFALYNKTQCYFNGNYIPKSDAFIANTAIEYEGEYIAIWMITEEVDDFDSLTASIVHEMFHGYQKINHESRWNNEMEALLKYQYSIENLSLKYQEAQLLNACLLNDDKEVFDELCKTRKKRMNNYLYEYDYEARIEQIEGTAKYIESKVLSLLNPYKGQKMHEKMMNDIINQKLYFPIRIISYSIGALLIEAINKYTDFDFESFTNVPFSIALLKNISVSSAEHYVNKNMSLCLKEYEKETKKLIDKTLTKNECIVEGKYPLLGVNVYNARCYNHYVTSTFFVVYQDNGKDKLLNGDFLVLLDNNGNVLKIFKQ